jgi:predicted MFS family arabinose efflux permease
MDKANDLFKTFVKCWKKQLPMAPILFHPQLQPIPLDAISAALCDAKADQQSSAKELRGDLPERPAPFTLISVQESAPSPPVSTSQKSQPYLGLGSPVTVAAVCLCGVFAFLNLYVTQPMLPMFEDLFRASKSAVGLTVSASTLGIALSAPFLGALAERLSRKQVIVIALLVLAAPTLLAASAPGLDMLIFWRFIQGLVMPAIFATVITYIGEEWASTAIALIMSIYVSGTALGGFLGRLIGGVAAEYLGWHWSFLLLGLTTLAGAAIIARTLPRERRPLPTHPHPGLAAQLRSMLRHFRNPHLLATFTVGFGMLFALVSTFTYVTFYLAAPPFHLSTAALSYLFAIYLIGLLVTPAGGYLITRIGLRYGIVLAIALCLLGECLTLVHSLPVIIFGGLALVCTGVFLAQSAAASFLRIAAPEGGRVSAAGLYLSCYYLGGTVGGVLPAVAWEIGKWPACVALTSAVLFAIVFVGWAGFQVPHPARTALD